MRLPALSIGLVRNPGETPYSPAAWSRVVPSTCDGTCRSSLDCDSGCICQRPKASSEDVARALEIVGLALSPVYQCVSRKE
jgi:hypothetical protein